MARSRRTSFRHAAAVGAAVVAPVALVACGGSGDITMIRGEGAAPTTTVDGAAPTDAGATGGHRSVTLAALHSAGDRTSEVTSGRFEMTMSAGEGDPFMTASGEFGGGRARQTMEMNLAGLGSMFGVEGEDASDIPSGFGAETVIDGNTAYIKSSMMAEMAGILGTDGASADSWYKIDGGDLGSGDDSLADMGAIYGSETARLLSGAYGEVTTVGTEEVRGVTTTHSKVTIDPSKVVGTAAGLERDLGDVEFVADVWIGEDGLLHRLRFETDASKLDLPTGDGPSMILDFQMWDLGTDIEVAVPDASEVVDSSELFGSK